MCCTTYVVVLKYVQKLLKFDSLLVARGTWLTSPCMWARRSDSFLMNRTWQKWHCVTFKTSSEKGIVASSLISSALSLSLSLSSLALEEASYPLIRTLKKPCSSPGSSLRPAANDGLRPPANSREWAIREADPPAPVQPSDDCSHGLCPDYNFMRDHKWTPPTPSTDIHAFLTLRILKVLAMKSTLFQTAECCDSNQ